MENNFSNIKERILYISEYYNVGKEDFFEAIGVTYGNFKGEAKKRPLNSDTTAKILSMYPNINPDWLLTGKGEMLRQSEPKVLEDKNNTVNEPKTEYITLNALEVIKLKDEHITFLKEQVADLKDKLNHEICEKKLRNDIKKVD